MPKLVAKIDFGTDSKEPLESGHSYAVRSRTYFPRNELK